MERYKVIKEVGDGTFGSVFRAVNKQSGEIVAIKKMKKKYFSWEECINLREVKSLRRMSHPNIVKLREVIRENDTLFFVFEYMECNLYQLMKNRGKPFTEAEVRNWCFQVFHALAHMHQRGYFHRDLKPENLLVTKNVIKMADFGLAREISSEPPYTEYVSTRWYRAPEVLLQATSYNSAVDMWAMGAIIAELFTLRPLFPGSNEADEMYKICSVIGTPDHDTWSDGLCLAESLNFQFPMCERANLFQLIPSASEEAVSLISWLCLWDPNRRPTASEALQHSFFQPCYYVPPSLRYRSTNFGATPPSGIKGAMGQRSIDRHPVGNNFSGAKLECNNWQTNARVSYKTGVQRKLEMDNKVLDNNYVSRNSMKQSQGKLTPMNNYSNPVYNGTTKDTPRVSDVADQLSQLSVRSKVNNSRVVSTDMAEGKLTSIKATNGGVHYQVPNQVPSNFKAGGWQGQGHGYCYGYDRTDYAEPVYQAPYTRNFPSRKLVSYNHV
ncbi:cyclin-dependent kinase F-4-like [Carex rostrata]